MVDSPLNTTLRYFEATEANLEKAEKALAAIEAVLVEEFPSVDNADYEMNFHSLNDLVEALPAIDGWRPDVSPMELSDIVEWRFQVRDIGEPKMAISLERQIAEPSRGLREYRRRFNQKRRELIRDVVHELVESIDANLEELAPLAAEDNPSRDTVDAPAFEQLKESVAQIHTLLGSSVTKPARWSDLHRHMRFGMVGDLRDIITHDWPSAKASLSASLYGELEPMPVGVEDLGTLVENKPRGLVATKLQWDRLSDEDFERLIFALITSETGYENPEWLTKTNAPDRGRDLSVSRVLVDRLGGTIRHRVIIQCKHWLSRSVAPGDISTLRDQMKMWEPPRVDVHIIATSGRFTSDAVAIVEKQNQSDTALRIEMWPESHLEVLLAGRPAIIAEFALR